MLLCGMLASHSTLLLYLSLVCVVATRECDSDAPPIMVLTVASVSVRLVFRLRALQALWQFEDFELCFTAVIAARIRTSTQRLH
jgi:hypothetical protein